MATTRRARAKPQQKAIDSATATARAGGRVSACPYRNKAWRTVWIRAFAAAQQVDMLATRTTEAP